MTLPANKTEYNCCECGVHVIGCVPSPLHPYCALCVWLPGWWRSAELRKRFAHPAMPTYTVIVENGWSYIVTANGYREGPIRYRWEAQEWADEMNQTAIVSEQRINQEK